MTRIVPSLKEAARVVLLLALPLTITGCAKSAAKLVAGPAAGSLESATTLDTALAILNRGTEPAENVEAKTVTLESASLTAPSLPVAVGSIRPDARGTVRATFSAASFTPGNSYVMKVAGSYTEGGHTFDFAVQNSVRIPPASPGSASASTGTSPATTVTGPHYPHQPPNFPPEVNESKAPPVPTGPYHAPAPPPAATGAKPIEADPPPVNFFTNDSVGIGGSSINEPSGAVGGNVVFMTANTYAAYSTNGGANFNEIDPTTLFPSTDGGLCCDQVVQYVASIDRFVWVMQYWGGKNAAGQNEDLYRIAAASPASVQSSQGQAWTYWDITSTQLGDTSASLDYPDTAVGNNSFYLSFDQQGGRVIVRIPLNEIQAGTTINFQYTHPGDSTVAYFGHISQNTRDEVFWAGHNSNSSMRVFSWAEGSNTYFWRDVTVGTWPNNEANLTSTSPDGQDWLTKLRGDNNNFISGSTRLFSQKGDRQTNQVWFAWTAPSGNGFAQPQVQWVALDRNNNFNLAAQSQIWNASYAFAYPALSTDANNEVGLSLEYGGGGNYENHVVGFWGDFVVYITTSSNTGTNRYGDYVTIRQDAAHTNRFDALGFGLQKNTGTDTHFIVFGRPGS
jgi:hypothetical protein